MIDRDTGTQCSECGSHKIIKISAECGDRCTVTLGTLSFTGEVPDGFGIGGGEVLYLEYCANCGQIQGDFPLDEPTLDDAEEMDDQ